MGNIIFFRLKYFVQLIFIPIFHSLIDPIIGFYYDGFWGLKLQKKFKKMSQIFKLLLPDLHFFQKFNHSQKEPTKREQYPSPNLIIATPRLNITIVG